MENTCQRMTGGAVTCLVTVQLWSLGSLPSALLQMCWQPVSLKPFHPSHLLHGGCRWRPGMRRCVPGAERASRCLRWEMKHPTREAACQPHICENTQLVCFGWIYRLQLNVVFSQDQLCCGAIQAAITVIYDDAISCVSMTPSLVQNLNTAIQKLVMEKDTFKKKKNHWNLAKQSWGGFTHVSMLG